MTSFTVVALVALLRIVAWGYRTTVTPRTHHHHHHQRRHHQRLQPLSVSPPPEESNPPSMVEDDGYTASRRERLRGLFLNKVLTVLNPRSEPGALILVRHGQTVLNYNKV